MHAHALCDGGGMGSGEVWVGSRMLCVTGCLQGETCLHYTVTIGHAEITRDLLAAGAHVNQQDNNGVCFLTALLWCLGGSVRASSPTSE